MVNQVGFVAFMHDDSVSIFPFLFPSVPGPSIPDLGKK
jgi:hypothetical protein